MQLRQAILTLMLLAPMSIYAGTATGFVRIENGCSEFAGDHLHILRVGKKKLDTPIVVAMPREDTWPDLPNSWMEVYPVKCSAPDVCASVDNAKIFILQVQRRYSIRWRHRIISGFSGKFSAQFKDRTKIEGTLKAKVRKPTRKFICE